MSLNCGISAGIDINCDALRKVSGVAKKIWVFNKSDLRVPIAPDSAGALSGYVTALEFSGYDGLYAFESKKNSHQATSELAVSDGGNVSYNQTVIIRVFNDTPTEDTAIEDLAVAEVGVVVHTQNDEFLVYGAKNGLSATSDTQGTGRNAGEDIASIITLTGSEPKRFYRFSRGNVTDSLAYLEALEV